MERKGVNFGHLPWNALYPLKTCDNYKYVLITSFQKHIDDDVTPGTFRKMTGEYKVKKNNRNFILVEDLCTVVDFNKLFLNDEQREIVYNDLLSLKGPSKDWCSYFIGWFLEPWATNTQN